MNKQSYLDSKQLQTECNECIKILKSELLEIEKVSNNIKLVLSETGLKGEAMEAYKKQLRRYFEIFALMKEADKFDIIDYSKLKADATKTYDGDLICTSYERAKNDRDKYQSKANDERSKAASFNTTVTTLLPGGKVLVEHIPNPYESSAREYQNLADDCQKEMNLWHSKMEEFDAIEARTTGLFVAGKNKRTIAKMKLRTLNKTHISASRTRSGGGTGGLISYIPDTPKTTINEDVLKGTKILEEELRKMKNEDGTPKYTEQEIKEMVEYVIKKHPSDLVALFNVSDQFKTQQMDLCKQYAIDSKKMIPIDRGADLFADYLRNLTNEDGMPMYTEDEIEEMVAYVLEHHPSSLSTLYYAPSQYYRNAAEQCLEYGQAVFVPEYDVVIPEVVHGNVDGQDITLYPRETWGIFGGKAYGSGMNVDSQGRYKVAVGPAILDPDYPDNGGILRSDFDFPVPIDLYLKDKNTGEITVIHCVVDDIKAHTYNSYPEGNASFDVPNGMVQTGVAYPKSWNYSNETPFARGNIDGSVVEFMGCSVDFDISNYTLEGIEIVD